MVEIVYQKDALIVKFVEDLSIITLESAREFIFYTAITNKKNNLVFDLTGINKIDSAGLGFITKIGKLYKEKDKNFHLMV